MRRKPRKWSVSDGVLYPERSADRMILGSSSQLCRKTLFLLVITDISHSLVATIALTKIDTPLLS